MAYLDPAPRNWGALFATGCAVPALLLWTLIEIVGGTLACEGVEGPCGPGAIDFLIGVAAIATAAASAGWLINRVVDRIRR